MLLFLDFDGVLHPEVLFRWEARRLFEALPQLQQWLRRSPEVEVVVSSAWRLQEPWAETLERFEDDLRPRVVGRTPDLADRLPWLGQREAEIAHWRQHHGRWDEPWIALDDLVDFFSDGCPQLILCDGKTGMGAPQVRALEAWYRANLPGSGEA